jgi:hypothetical protein
MWFPLLILGAVALFVFVPSGFTREYLPPSSQSLLDESRAIVRNAVSSFYDVARAKALALLREQLHDAIDESVK